MPPTPTFQLVDRALSGQLEKLLTDWRSEGRSLEEISYLLRKDHEIKLSAATLYRWCLDLSIEKGTSEDGAA